MTNYLITRDLSRNLLSQLGLIFDQLIANGIKRTYLFLPARHQSKLLDDLLKSTPLKIDVVLHSSERALSRTLVDYLKEDKSEHQLVIDIDRLGTLVHLPDLLKHPRAADGLIISCTHCSNAVRRTLSSMLHKGITCDLYSPIKLFHQQLSTHLEYADFSLHSDRPLLGLVTSLGQKVSVFEKIDSRHAKFPHPVRFGGALLSHFLYRISKPRVPLQIAPTGEKMLHSGVVYKGKSFVTHTTLSHHQSAIVTITPKQRLFVLTLLAIILSGFLFDAKQTAIILVGILSTIYFVDVVFNLFLILKSLHFPPELSFSAEDIATLKDKDLPVYTVLCPLYKEAKVLPAFVDAMSKMDWPKDKIEVLLLLEQDDEQTQAAAKALDLPKYFKTIIVPHSFPKTKPKACNFGLSIAIGEYVVIYDAEDHAEYDQLKKAYLGFQQMGDKVACLQAKLNYHNPSQNLLTRFFTAEYSLWFDVVLPGLQSINTTIPLGGTSNHFRTSDLVYFEGWDSFNVTEDCDLGSRLFKEGYRTAIINSTTLEEANSNWGNWLRQRSRWIKGYMQTYLVHNRDPWKFFRTNGLHALIFQLVVGGKIAFMLINPFLWLATIAYFVLYQFVGPAIEALYPTVIFYMAAFSLIVGNFMFLYYYMIGCAKKGHWSLIKFVYLIPFYWLMVSLAALKAFKQLILKPHYWEKTNHGLNLPVAKPEKIKKIFHQEVIYFLSTHIGRFKALSNSKLISGGFLVFAALISNFLNFLYNAYLGRHVDATEFGLVGLVGSFLYLSSVPTSATSKMITYRAGYLLGKYQGPVRNFWKHYFKRVAIIGFVLSIIWAALTPLLMKLFQTTEYIAILSFAPVWFIGLTTVVNRGFLAGNQLFVSLAIIAIFESVIKLLLAMLFINLKLVGYVYLATPISILCSLIFSFILVRTLNTVDKKTLPKDYDESVVKYFPKRFFLASIVAGISSVVFLSLDVILAKVYLPPVQAGQYALLSLVGKMIYLVGSLFSQFMTPVISKVIGEGRKSESTFTKILLATSLASTFAYIGVGLLGRFTTPLLFGNKVLPIVEFLPLYGLAIVAFTIGSSIIEYHQVRRQYLFSILGFSLALIQLTLTYFFHDHLSSFVDVIVILSVIYLVVILLLHTFYDYFIIALSNVRDFLELFVSPFKKKPQLNTQLKVLIFNWRDTKHIWTGGAETYIQEIGEDWVKKDIHVTIFCGNDGKHLRNEIVNGINVVRRGGFYTVYLWAALYYIFKFRGKFDLVIDSQNGIPFFTPLYVRKPIYLLIHHIHQDVFRQHLAYPLAQIAMFAESVLMPFVYRNAHIITVSESSKKDIQKLKLTPKQNIDIVNPGTLLPQLPKGLKKTPYPTFCYVGRLKPYKNIDVAIHAFATILSKHPNAKFVIAGEGEAIFTLKPLVEELDLTDSVSFIGRISDDEKYSLLAQSWAMIQPSSFEGWGITVIEANACGTPVIASDVIGLRDSVLADKTGLLFPAKDKNALVAVMKRIIASPLLRSRLTRNGKIWALEHTWQLSSHKLLQIVTSSHPALTVHALPSFK